MSNTIDVLDKDMTHFLAYMEEEYQAFVSYFETTYEPPSLDMNEDLYCCMEESVDAYNEIYLGENINAHEAVAFWIDNRGED